MSRPVCGNIGSPAFSIFRSICECIRQPGHVAQCSCSCGLSFKSETPAIPDRQELPQKVLALTP